jgi:hypothetical protein
MRLGEGGRFLETDEELRQWSEDAQCGATSHYTADMRVIALVDEVIQLRALVRDDHSFTHTDGGQEVPPLPGGT